MKTRLVTCVVLASTVALSLNAADSDRPSSSSYWMRKKLEYSERLLGGLTGGDFVEIGQSARSMNALTSLERWVHAERPGYREQSKAFQAANERILRAAAKEDLDAAAEGFNQLTMSCVSCHKIVRDAGPPR